MLKYILLLLIFLLFAGILSAQENHMDITTTMTGEFNFSLMGAQMTTLDWNGDGFDDLIILSPNWNPGGHTNPPPFPCGKYYIYFGGPNFDNVPEMEMPGTHEIEYGNITSMCNAGDMNGDGIDDLALFRATMYTDNDDQHYDLQLCVFYGGANPDTITDYVLTFPRENWTNDKCDLRSLGDINQDGYDDIGYIMAMPGYSGPETFGIIYGGSMTNSIFLEAGSGLDMVDMHGVGDVNADGIDDFTIGYMYLDNNDRYFKDILYFGKQSMVYSDSLVLGNALTIKPYSYPVGDLNWDGYPDFISSFTYTSATLYFGGPNFNGANFVYISPSYNGTSSGEGFSHGDVNGNGTDDLMGTYCSQGNGYGDAYLWMGGVPMNGTPDLHITPPSLEYVDMEMFGWCLTMGDYNGDGCCDAAISAPFDYASWPMPGHVFVYAGNRQLNDPTPIADDTVTPVISQMQLYPNPIRSNNSTLNVRFTLMPPLPPSSRGVITFEIYNIKGQKVKSFIINTEQTKTGSVSYNLNDLSSGVYVCVYTSNKQQIKGKITIIRKG
jgi:hypothetical protein